MSPGLICWKLRVLRRGLSALLFSILSPGLGQIYNGQLLRGALFYALVPAFLMLSSVVGLLQTYRGFITHIVLNILLFVFIVADAVWMAGRQAVTTTPRRGWHAYVLGAIMLLVSGVAAVGNVVPDRLPGVHAYKVPTDSMAPTVISGDGVVVDMRYYENHAPSRGDVAALATPPKGTLTVKRVLALAGDVIEGTPRSITVNGQIIREPYLGTLSDATDAPSDPALTFGPITVPPNRMFVMGDNQNHSYDSRYFGTVTIEGLKGKVLYIYSSADKSRVGRTIR